MAENGMKDEAAIDEIIREVDTNKVRLNLLCLYKPFLYLSQVLKTQIKMEIVVQDGSISYEEFVAMMTKGT